MFLRVEIRGYYVEIGRKDEEHPTEQNGPPVDTPYPMQAPVGFRQQPYPGWLEEDRDAR
ncbi:hypothetical protein [Desertihabitans brevis]|uniref:hypothetical protein n=1 Tax=Desertihabitans brevis TaxID=2268447 RepID=UPI001313F2DB|nr:hypothetical protein [Desertihabitans brevis]